MISFFVSLALLIIGYFAYSKVVVKLFGKSNKPTPAIEKNDGIDYVPMPTWRAFLVELLDIAGTGPIFGALMGACFGPVVFLWIVFGCILGGAVHDYCTGMISVRHGGGTISEITGRYLGKGALWAMRIFIILLLILVGTVFITSPAQLLAHLTPDSFTQNFWVVVIIIYFLLATILPIDKVIGRFYPIFGAILIVMAVSIIVAIIFQGYQIPEIDFMNHNPKDLPIWPFMFITVACGAISGFHATQAPLISRCIKTQENGRVVFYGAMIAEGIIALIWAAAGVAFYDGTQALQTALDTLGTSGVVYEISVGLLGNIGAILAIVGVAICPITSGDTAFRSARLTIAEIIHLDQEKYKNRFIIAIPMFVIASILSQIDFNIIWRYFSWSNQVLAMLVLWVSSLYLWKFSKYKFGFLITALPALFMSAVTCTYLFMAPEGFQLSAQIGYPAGVIFAVLCGIIFVIYLYKHPRNNNNIKLDKEEPKPVPKLEE